MEPREKLKAWMDANGYTKVALAKALGLSYEYIYKIVKGKNDKYMTDTFKYRFIASFGMDEALKVFDVTVEQETV